MINASESSPPTQKLNLAKGRTTMASNQVPQQFYILSLLYYDHQKYTSITDSQKVKLTSQQTLKYFVETSEVRFLHFFNDSLGYCSILWTGKLYLCTQQLFSIIPFRIWNTSFWMVLSGFPSICNIESVYDSFHLGGKSIKLRNL